MSSGLPATPPFVEGNILHAFIWTKDNGIKSQTVARTYPQHVDSEAYGINEAGQVVGVSCAADQTDCRAVIWDHSVYPTDLNDHLKGSDSGFLALAKDINDKGEITGEVSTQLRAR